LKTLDDATLLNSVVAGSKSAMSEIYDRYSHTCYAIAMRILDSPTAAEEVTRDCLLDVWREPSNFRSRHNVLPIWLTLTTRRRALEFRESSGRTNDENEIPMPDPHELGLSKLQTWRLDKFKRIVAALPADQKQVLELVWFKGLGNDELAQQTGLSLDKIHSRLHAALDTLHKALDADE
jgi:RNA polymerase sigma-70 factor (ECF subfamily)